MKFLVTLAFIVLLPTVYAQQSTTATIVDNKSLSPAKLPGKGLAQHDFFYAGENGVLSMYIVKGGKIVWSYTHPGKGEISDAELLSDGSVLFAHQFGVTKISADKKILWNYDAPAGSEIHTAQQIGKDYVVFVQNGNPAKLVVTNITTGNTEKEIDLHVKNPEKVHGQFRHARLTDAGTILIGYMSEGKVVEYDADGNVLWTTEVPEPWSAIPLKNGNILVSGGSKKTVTEINRKGESVWKFSAADLPDYTLSNIQVASLLRNGNYLINNWTGKGNGTSIQAIEIDKNKKVVWALRSWDVPADLGPSTTIQLLDKPLEKRHFGKFK